MKYQLDVRHLLCPMPVIETQRKVQQLRSGDELTIYCTDPGSLQDIPCWCRISGHRLISVQQQNHDIVITISIGDQRVP